MIIFSENKFLKLFHNIHIVIHTSKVPAELASGCIINVMLHSNEVNINTIKFIAKNYKADYIIVIDSEKIYRQLNEIYSGSDELKLVKLPASSGVVDLNDLQRQALKNMSYRNYFKGKTDKLDIFEAELSLDEYVIFMVEILTIPISALPTGAKEDATKITVKRLNPNEIPIQNKLLGILDLQDAEKLSKIEKEIESGSKDSKEEFYSIIISSLCTGFAHIISHDANKNILRVFSSHPDGPKSMCLLKQLLMFSTNFYFEPHKVFKLTQVMLIIHLNSFTFV